MMVAQNILRKSDGKQDFSEINFKIATAFKINKYLVQIKSSVSLHTIYYNYHSIDVLMTRVLIVYVSRSELNSAHFKTFTAKTHVFKQQFPIYV